MQGENLYEYKDNNRRKAEGKIPQGCDRRILKAPQ